MSSPVNLSKPQEFGGLVLLKSKKEKMDELETFW